MSYEAFIERADSQPGITLAEWETYVARDHELKWQNEARVTSPSGDVVVMPTPHCAIWIGARGATALFCWSRNAVAFERPTPESIAKAKKIAAALRASVVGEEGEKL